MQQAVNHWIMVKKIAEKKSIIILPDGEKEKIEAYCRILNAGPLAKIEETGYAIGDIIYGPRVLWIPGLPPNVGLMSGGDPFYKMDKVPDGVTILEDVTTVEDVLHPKPVTDEVES